jgi:hypothetical protein
VARTARRSRPSSADLPADTIITGIYKFGANELSIMRVLDRIVSHLERSYGLDLGKTTK